MLDEIAAGNLKFWPIISQGGTYTYNAVKVIAYYLRPFVKTNKLKKTLWPLFMDGVQLPEGHRVTTKGHFTFYHWL